MYPWVAASRKYLGETLVNGFLSYPSFTSDATIIADISKVLCVLKHSSFCTIELWFWNHSPHLSCSRFGYSSWEENTEGCWSWFWGWNSGLYIPVIWVVQKSEPLYKDCSMVSYWGRGGILGRSPSQVQEEITPPPEDCLVIARSPTWPTGLLMLGFHLGKRFHSYDQQGTLLPP